VRPVRWLVLSRRRPARHYVLTPGDYGRVITGTSVRAYWLAKRLWGAPHILRRAAVLETQSNASALVRHVSASVEEGRRRQSSVRRVSPGIAVDRWYCGRNTNFASGLVVS
jgi:hypothetical protein